MACGASEQIEVVDSRLAGGAQALLALSAARWAGEMADHRQVARRVERSIERNHGFVLIDTLKYLAMGGRIGRAQALLGGVLQFNLSRASTKHTSGAEQKCTTREVIGQRKCPRQLFGRSVTEAGWRLGAGE